MKPKAEDDGGGAAKDDAQREEGAGFSRALTRHKNAQHSERSHGIVDPLGIPAALVLFVQEA